MYDTFFKIDDQVIVNIPSENREWGYNPCPDGTIATIVMPYTEIYYSRINKCGRKPGVYKNTNWTVIRLPNGKTYAEYTSRLQLVDQKEAKSRLRESQNPNGKKLDSSNLFIRDLPETRFWEGDFVTVNNGDYQGIHQITSIDYKYSSTPTPAYWLSTSLTSVRHIFASEANLTLVKRGPIWKYYHHEPIEFKDPEEKADLHLLLGLFDDVRNPKNNLYCWTLDEVLEAVKDGLVHGFSVLNLFSSSASISAFKFHDEELGAQISQMTLSGFQLGEKL